MLIHAFDNMTFILLVTDSSMRSNVASYDYHIHSGGRMLFCSLCPTRRGPPMTTGISNIFIMWVWAWNWKWIEENAWRMVEDLYGQSELQTGLI